MNELYPCVFVVNFHVFVVRMTGSVFTYAAVSLCVCVCVCVWLQVISHFHTQISTLYVCGCEERENAGGGGRACEVDKGQGE